jgi:prephenate dehydrogenase
VPHLVAAAVAAGLEDAPREALLLAGQGVRDVTRIAASSPDMWAQILAGNAGPVSELLARVARELDAGAAGLAAVADGDDDARKVVTDVLERGRAGVARLPGKRGGPAPEYAMVQVVIPDRPGELARLFQVVGEAGINIEDIDIEHSPGLPVGVAELWVRPEAVQAVTGVLAAGGWPVRR